MSKEIEALKCLSQPADAMEQHRGQCKIGRDLILKWLLHPNSQRCTELRARALQRRYAGCDFELHDVNEVGSLFEAE